MNFGKKIAVQSLPLSESTSDLLYADSNPNDEVSQHHKSQLENIILLFKSEIEKFDGDFNCFIDKKALDAFIAFANEVYQTSRHEATGIIVGYYLHDENNPNKKIIVGTNFLQATGSSSNVTCEFSYEDSIRHSQYCDRYKVQPIIWIHSHPGFGVFYSQTDSSTLRGYFNCAHQMGIVVDNLQSQFLGFKIWDGKQQLEDIQMVDIDNCLLTSKLSYSNISFRKLPDSNTEKKKVYKF